MTGDSVMQNLRAAQLLRAVLSASLELSLNLSPGKRETLLSFYQNICHKIESYQIISCLVRMINTIYLVVSQKWLIGLFGFFFKIQIEPEIIDDFKSARKKEGKVNQDRICQENYSERGGN